MTISNTIELQRRHYLQRMQHESTKTNEHCQSDSRMFYTNNYPDTREPCMRDAMQVSCPAATAAVTEKKHQQKIKAQPMSCDELQTFLSRLEVSRGSKATNSGASIDELFQPDKDGDNLLMSAVIKNREDIANTILDMVPNYEYLDLQNKEGQTVLHLAVILDMVQLARRLIAWGSQVVTMDRNGNTALHLACRDGNLPAVLALTTPLSFQDIESRPYYVPFRRIPQDMEIRNYDGYTCLHMAALHEHYPIMDYIIGQAYADINASDRKSGETLLHFAIKTKNMVILAFLLRFRSLDVNQQRYDGLRPLDVVTLLGSKDMYDVLVRVGAESSQGTGDHGYEMCTEYDDITINGAPLL